MLLRRLGTIRNLTIATTVIALFGLSSQASAQFQTLTTGTGDASLSVDVTPGGEGDIGEYDPVGPTPSATTIFASRIYVGDSSGRTILDPSTGFDSVTTTSATSSFTFMGLDWTLQQDVGPIVRMGNTVGAGLTQDFTITNNGSTPITFDIVRYLDGDLQFDLTIDDGGGRITDPTTGQLVLFETDRGGTGSDDVTFVGITAEGGTVPTTNRFEIGLFPSSSSRISSGSPLGDSIVGDNDGDGFIDIGQEADVTLALRNEFTLGAGESANYVTETLFGTRPDTLFPPAGAVDDAYSTPAQQTLNVAAPGVLENDTDPNNMPITAVLVSDVSNGTLTLNPDGSFDYTPNTGFSGDDTFTYAADNGQSQSNAATVTISVLNQSPVAADDSYQVAGGQSLNQTAPGVLANDSDPDGDPITASLVSGPSSGTLNLNPDGSFTYTPNTGFIGTDSFTYTADDATGSSNPASVTIDVTNQAPVAAGDSYSVDAGNVLTINAPGVLMNDSDPDGQPLTTVLVTGPTNGTLSLNADGSFTYTPNSGFFGSDSFSYMASDGVAQSSPATASITVVSPLIIQCIDALTAIVDGYQSLADSTVAQAQPNIEALLQSGDRAGAEALQQSTIATLVQEAGNTTSALSAECTNCRTQLISAGQTDDLSQLDVVCMQLMHRVGSIQNGAVAPLESVVAPRARPTRAAMALRSRYLREIELNAARTTSAISVAMQRFTSSVNRRTGPSSSSLAQSTSDVVNRTTEARVARIQELCENFVTRMNGRAGTHGLVAEVTAAANAAMLQLQTVQFEANRKIQQSL